MDSWGNLVDCPSEQEFPEHLQRFQVVCSPWPMFTDYVCETWIVPHKEKFILAWTNKVMHLGNTTTNRYKFPFLDFVGVTPTGMNFSAGFAYLEGECMNNLVWALERFRDLF